MHRALLIIYRALFRVYRAISEPCSIQGSFQRTHASRFTLGLLSCVLSCGQALFSENTRLLFSENTRLLFSENTRLLFSENTRLLFSENTRFARSQPSILRPGPHYLHILGCVGQQYPANYSPYFFWVLLEICFWCSWKCALSRLWERWCMSRTRCCGWCGCSRC